MCQHVFAKANSRVTRSDIDLIDVLETFCEYNLRVAGLQGIMWVRIEVALQVKNLPGYRFLASSVSRMNEAGKALDKLCLKVTYACLAPSLML